MPKVNLVIIQPFLRSLKLLSFFFSVSVSIQYVFFLFAWRFHKVFASHQSFHVFSCYVICYFLLMTRMRTCKNITSARRVISPGAFT